MGDEDTAWSSRRGAYEHLITPIKGKVKSVGERAAQQGVTHDRTILFQSLPFKESSVRTWKKYEVELALAKRETFPAKITV